MYCCWNISHFGKLLVEGEDIIIFKLNNQIRLIMYIYRFFFCLYLDGLKLLASIFYPPFCSFCKIWMVERKVFCQNCFNRIDPIVSHNIFLTKRFSVTVFSVSSYKEPLKPLILSKNYSDIVASRQLGELIWDLTYIKNINFDYIIPVPLHWSRFAKRGFNQAEEMAYVIAKKSGKEVVNLLKRTKRTKYQAGLDSCERAINIMSAFELYCDAKNKYLGKKLLLIDDLMTTGATLKSAAKMLLQLRPMVISAAVVCRVV